MKKKLTEDMSQNYELERILEKRIFIGKVEKGIPQSEHSITIPHDQVKEIIKQW